MRRYLASKGLNVHGHVEKSRRERFLTTEQVKQILEAVKASSTKFNPNWRRDHCAIYLGYMLGLRIGEACLLERRHFRNLESDQLIVIPTLKQAERITFECSGCAKKIRVRSTRAGQNYRCRYCEQLNPVPQTSRDEKTFRVPEQEPPFIEGQVVDYCLDYLNNVMRPDQRWLFEGSRKKKNGEFGHLSRSYMSRIFNTYTSMAGLSNRYSWHALRHGRGRQLYRFFKDLILVRDGLRHKSMSAAEIYAHLDPDEENEYKKKLESVALEQLDDLRITVEEFVPKGAAACPKMPSKSSSQKASAGSKGLSSLPGNAARPRVPR